MSYKTRNGLYVRALCLECCNRLRREKHKANPQKNRALDENRRRKRTPQAKEFIKEYKALYFQKNKEEIQAKKKLYHEANREAAQARNYITSKKRRVTGYRAEVKAMAAEIKASMDSYRIGDEYWDVYNSCLIKNPTVDHIIPLSAGGANKSDNFAPTTGKTNSSKGSAPLIVWMARQARIAAKLKARLSR